MRRDEGAAAVEFALVAPLALLLLFGLLYFGLASVWGALAEHNARVGVRYATIPADPRQVVSPPLTIPDASVGAEYDASGTLAVDPDGTVHVAAGATVGGSASASADVPQPSDFTTDPTNVQPCAAVGGNPQSPYPSRANVAAQLVSHGYRVAGIPTKVVVTPEVPSPCPQPGDKVMVTVTYHVPGVSGLLGLLGFGASAGDVTRSATARRE